MISEGKHLINLVALALYPIDLFKKKKKKTWALNLFLSDF